MSKKKITKKTTKKRANSKKVKTKKKTVKAKKSRSRNNAQGYEVIFHLIVKPRGLKMEYKLLHDFADNKHRVYSRLDGEKLWKFEYESKVMAGAFGRLMGKAFKIAS